MLRNNISLKGLIATRLRCRVVYGAAGSLSQCNINTKDIL